MHYQPIKVLKQCRIPPPPPKKRAASPTKISEKVFWTKYAQAYLHKFNRFSFSGISANSCTVIFTH